MIRAVLCTLLLTAGSAAFAGELDREPAKAAKTAPAVAATGGSELDQESPQAAHRWRAWYGRPAWGWGGYYPGVSYYNYGFAPAFYGYQSFGFSYSYGYSNFYPAWGYAYPAYYAPYGWGYYW